MTASRTSSKTIAKRTVVGVLCAAMVAWLLVSQNPALTSPTMSWQSASFVEQPRVGAAEDQKPTWVVWDQPSGAWASVVVHNARPYPVTVSPGSMGNVAQVQIARFDPAAGDDDISASHVTAVSSLRVPAGGYLVVSLRVSDRCVPMSAGGATGDDSATVNVTTLGLTASLDVPFPATYMAGTTTGHAADPSCATQ